MFSRNMYIDAARIVVNDEIIRASDYYPGADNQKATVQTTRIVDEWFRHILIASGFRDDWLHRV